MGALTVFAALASLYALADWCDRKIGDRGFWVVVIAAGVAGAVIARAVA